MEDKLMRSGMVEHYKTDAFNYRPKKTYRLAGLRHGRTSTHWSANSSQNGSPAKNATTPSSI